MTRHLLLAASVLILGSTFARAQNPPADSGQTLPRGHPDVSAMMGPTTQPALPAGHPALPAGHPALPASGDMGAGQLPSGHPDISAMMNRPAPSSAKVVVRVKQGTKGGPAIGAEPVTIDWYQPDQPVQQFQTRLDEHGTAFIDHLPLTTAGQPLVTVTHNGVAHEAPGEIMNAGRPDQVVEVTVYETAPIAPAWNISMWHVVVMPAPTGFSVTQVLMVNNPSDRNWLGSADANGKHTIFTLPIPASAQNVQINNGIHDLPATIAGGKLAVGVPLMAGTTQYQITYLLPLDQNKAKIELVAPAPVGQLMVFMPEAGTSTSAQGLGAAQTTQTPQGAMRFYKARGLATSASASLEIVKTTKAGAMGPQSSSDLPKVIAAVGGGSLLAIGAAVALYKSPRQHSKTARHPA